MRPRHIIPSLLSTIIAGALLFVPARPVAAGGPITWTWPNGSCSGTLQECVSTAGSGDSIQIATNELVDERPTWQDKSLSITPAPGFTPVIAKGLKFTALTGARTLSIDGIRFNGAVDILMQGGSGHVVSLDRVTIQSTSGGISGSARYILASVPASVSVLHATISNRRDGGGGVLFDGSNAAGLVSFALVGSHISAPNHPESGAGLDLYARGAGGTVNADVYNTIVHDVARCGCGGASGIHLLGGQTAQARFRLVGVTLDRSGYVGLAVDDRMDPGGSMDVRVYNSIVSRSSFAGVHISTLSGSTLDFRAGHNAYSTNGANRLTGRSLGSHNVTGSPGYVDRSKGDLRLRSDSPLIDRGEVCSPGGIANPDADGHHRLQGASVDIGAYERNGPAVTGRVILNDDRPGLIFGTEGRDIICGYGGPDELYGVGGGDYVDGGADSDFVHGGLGADRLHGRGGADWLCARDGAATDRIDGGPGPDRYGTDPGDRRTSVETVVDCPT